MLEKINLSKKMSKKECKTMMEQLEPQLSLLQRKLKEYKVPVVILFEGFGASGKGTLINQLIQPMDPRGFKVFTIQKPTEEDVMRPYLWRFWTKLPENGRIHLFDRSWYTKIVESRAEKQRNREKTENDYNDILAFEQELAQDGMLIIKFFLHISRKEQKKRLQALEDNKETKWRVTEDDWKHNKAYEDWLKAYEEMIQKTDTSYGEWTIVEATDREYAKVKIISAVVEKFANRLAEEEAKKANSTDTLKNTPETSKNTSEAAESIQFGASVLDAVDLSKSLSKTEYKKKLENLQNRMTLIQSELYKRRIPVVIGFEGWDAGGKGGAIHRLTQTMDPRGYEVIPTAAPNDIEKAHHYLWRFWNRMPKAGHVAIFDRTWYGRVMVERIEGFCSEKEWRRAYNEINRMEAQLADAGAIVLKFWMHIDKEEQKKRFEERMENPNKQWKITDEDWRNREKWDAYVKAVDEMIVRTSTTYAPWIIIEGNDKLYARIKVLETVVNAIEERLK
jgi:polyphosphate:AMP phosphotransferase